MQFNAFGDAWLPVTLATGSQATVSLRDVLLHGDIYTGLGASLTPVEREAHTRFLHSLFGAVVQHVPAPNRSAIVEDNRFAPDDVNRFADLWADRFNVFTDNQPFLQRWDVPARRRHIDTCDPSLLTKTGTFDPVDVAPLESLFPETPGNSARRWALRLDRRNPGDPRVLTSLLVTTWFMTLNGNGKGHRETRDPKGRWVARQMEYGNPANTGKNSLSIHWNGPTLFQTLLAGIEEAWVDPSADPTRPSLPMWLVQDADVDPAWFASAHRNLWRTTYARNMTTLFYNQDGAVAGASVSPHTFAVPLLDATEKTSLQRIHDNDYARPYLADPKTGDLTPKRALPHLLHSTEGIRRWYEQHFADVVNTTWSKSRVLDPRHGDVTGWNLDVFADRYDGNSPVRQSATWETIPYQNLAVTGAAAVELLSILNTYTEASKALRRAYRFVNESTAKDDKGWWNDFLPVQVMLANAVEGPLNDAVAALATGNPPPSDTWAAMFENAYRVLVTTTRIFESPTRLPAVIEGHNRFKRAAYAHFNKTATTRTRPSFA